MNDLKKIKFDQLIADMQVFLHVPDVENSIQQDIESLVDKTLLARAQNGGRPVVDVLTDYLNAGSDIEDRLKIIIGFSGGSLERLKRIFAAIYPDEKWGAITNNEVIRRRIASFLTNPAAEEIFIPSFIRKSFYLPEDWINLLQDESYLQTIVRNAKQSKYSVLMGNAIEQEIIHALNGISVQWKKGQVELVNNKEVDVAIPDTKNPRILIMCSYALTTSSSQSSRANEQTLMYEEIIKHNRRKRARNIQAPVKFINVIDGGGWLSRQGDLRKIYEHCDYCFPYSDLNKLIHLIQKILE